MTKCGHTFCKGCIEEMINRFHRCPLCNQELTAQDIFRNIDFEDLATRIESAKETAVKEYLEGLAQGVVKDFGKEMGSLESVFVQNIQRSLLTFKDFQTNMHKELENKIGVIKLKYASIAENDPQDNVELQQKLADQTSKLEENYRRANELLLSQFDEHMK
jgi:hypothetical protein